MKRNRQSESLEDKVHLQPFLREGVEASAIVVARKNAALEQIATYWVLLTSRFKSLEQGNQTIEPDVRMHFHRSDFSVRQKWFGNHFEFFTVVVLEHPGMQLASSSRRKSFVVCRLKMAARDLQRISDLIHRSTNSHYKQNENHV